VEMGDYDHVECYLHHDLMDFRRRTRRCERHTKDICNELLKWLLGSGRTKRGITSIKS